MQHRRKGPPPENMLFLRDAIANATLSFNRQGELVHQAHYTRKRGSLPMEEFVVMVRQGSAMFFHLIWNQNLRDGEGDWEATNALACADLDELYQAANDQVKSILDSTRWDPI